MFSFTMFFNNLRYLGRYNIKKINREFDFVYDCFDHIKYEIEDDLAGIKRIKVADVDETIDKLINSDCSISRFGDGELGMIIGNRICFQTVNKELSRRLKEVLLSDEKNVLIAIPRFYNSLRDINPLLKPTFRSLFGRYKDKFLCLLNSDKIYYSYDFTQQYMLMDELKKKSFNFEEYFSKIRKIWDNKDITIVCGDRAFNNIKNNIFDNAKSIEYIYAPTVNAFDKYDDIFSKVVQTDKNKLKLLMLGPTATVLAYDLAKSGHRAIDIGHIAKDYDNFLEKVAVNDKNLSKFYGND